ncbi:hypothetical protein PGT21_012558 [Puccinia graminis f. sp. tritici]|uniref:Uncharacterized protein n=1 Tax=Puccinia graminis f. sp. tritici TaxID=56615 RepID=A0A5B0QI65_PUCGR|nr:hypothetical protein PGT21_012558 [Puccinia graminis f. sp. tritici]
MALPAPGNGVAVLVNPWQEKHHSTGGRSSSPVPPNHLLEKIPHNSTENTPLAQQIFSLTNSPMEPDIVLIFLAQLAILALLLKILVLVRKILAHVRQRELFLFFGLVMLIV